MLLFALSAFALAINLPFGYWRAKQRKFSLRWFLAIHLPIPLIFLFRYSAGYGVIVIPLLLLLAVAGQIIGGRIFDGRESRRRLTETTRH